MDLLDTYPFVDEVVIKEITGAQLLEALEQSFTLERGLLQVSGLTVTYDLSQPEGQRVVSVVRGEKEVSPLDRMTVSMPGFLAEGGDLYTVFADIDAQGETGKVTDVVIEYLARSDVLPVPPSGRQIEAPAQ